MFEEKKTATQFSGKEKLSLKIFRGGRVVTTNLTLLQEEQVFNSKVIEERLGLTVRTLTKDLAEQLGLSFYGGYLITKVTARGPGAEAGLEAGAVIQRVDDSQPQSLMAFARDIHGRETNDPVRLNVVWEIRRGAFTQRRSGVATVKAR